MVIILLVALIHLTSCDNIPPKTAKPILKISMAVMPHSFTSYSVFVAKEKGFFNDEGLDVTLQSFPHGKVTLNTLIEKKADIAVSH